MKSHTLTNLGLLALVIVLALMAIYEPGLETAQKAPPLTRLKPEEVHFIRLSDNRGRDLVLEKRQGAWRMTRPYEKAADEVRIGQLLGITTTRSFSRFAAPRDRLAEFGLAPPSIRLQLNDLELEIGGNEPLRFRRYVRIGDQIHLIGNGFHHHLMASAEDYVRQ
ncbi:MAG TPA: hypothetical protein ENI99_04625 [Sedimenticola sp.]|nr:hypothetical protein [Sedimenticola sp.]